MGFLSIDLKNHSIALVSRRNGRLACCVGFLPLALSVLSVPGLAAAQSDVPVAAAAPVSPAPAAPVAPAGKAGVSPAVQQAVRNSSSPKRLKTIEVTATAPDADLRQHQRSTPGEVHIVGGDTLYERPVNNTSDALRYVPGVMATSTTGGDDERISIRGSNLSNLAYDNSGFMLYQDGLPVSSADGANHNRLGNPFTASDIIVANGVNVLTYGASTLGGAINYVSRTALNSDPNRIYLQGGSHGLYSGYASTGGIHGDWDGMLTVGGRHFSGYREHSRENRYSVYGNVGWQVADNFKLRFYGAHIHSRQQLAGTLTRKEFDEDPRQAAPSYVLGNHQLDVDTTRAAVKGTWTINDKSKLEFGVSHEYQSLYHPIVTSPFFSLLIDTYQNTTGGMVRYHLKAGDHELLAGVNLAYTTNTGGNYENDYGHKGPRTDDISQRSGNMTLFLVDHWNFTPRWTLVYGAQGVVTGRNVYDKAIGGGVRHQKKTYSAFNPRLGLIFHINDDSQLYASISHVYQAPDNFQLDNMRAAALARNATLSAMHGWEYELGTRGHGDLPSDKGTWRWSLDAYYARLRDEVLAFGDPGNPDSANFDKTIHAGIEGLLSASYKITSSGDYLVEPLISATYNDFKFDHDATYHNNRLPSAPRYVVHGQVMFKNAATGLYGGPTFDFVGSRYADMANDYRVGGYALVGLRTGIKRGQWEAFMQVTNLTDKKYVSRVAAQTQADPNARVLNPGAPRMVYAGFRLYY